jgi:hypothetical protein
MSSPLSNLIKIAILTLILWTPQQVMAKDWYVRPAGGDYGSEDGTSHENAWDGFENIDWSDVGVGPGDTLYINGTHHEQLAITASGYSDNARLIISGAGPGDKGIIDGGHQVANCIFAVDKDYFTIQDLEVRDGTATGIQLRGPRHVSIHGVTAHHNGVDGIRVIAHSRNAKHIQIYNNTIFLNGQSGPFFHGAGISILALPGHCATIGDIYNNQIYSGRSPNRVGEFGIALYPSSGGAVSNFKIYENIVHEIEGSAINLANAVSFCRIYNNTCYNGTGPGGLIHLGGSSVGWVENCEIFGNICYNNVFGSTKQDAVGIFPDEYSRNNSWHHNKIFNNDEAGLKFNYSSGNRAYGNLFFNNGEHGIEIRGSEGQSSGPSSNNLIYNNTVAHGGTGSGIYISGYAGHAGPNSIINNIVFTSGASPYGISKSRNAHILEDNNIVYGFSENFDGLNAGPNSLVKDPLFIDAGNNDYSLQPSSPCINSGRNLGTSYNQMLIPGGEWPNSVITDVQDSYGNWEIGGDLFPGADSDFDGLPDEYELTYQLNPLSAGDSANDSDTDGLSNLEEFQIGTRPDLEDTDEDGIQDLLEWAFLINPMSVDSDSDNIDDFTEFGVGSEPLDTDKDGVSDPLDIDSDNDGVPDSTEANFDSDEDHHPDRIDMDSATILTDYGTLSVILDDERGRLVDVDFLERMISSETTPDIDFQYGGVEYAIHGIQPGGTARVRIALSSPLPSNVEFWKYEKSVGYYQYPVSVNNNKIEFILTDGEYGDNDKIANGVISDPGFIGLPEPIEEDSGYGCALNDRSVEKPKNSIQDFALLLTPLAYLFTVVFTRRILKR